MDQRYPDTKVGQTHLKERRYKPISFINIVKKNLQQNVIELNPATYKNCYVA